MNRRYLSGLITGIACCSGLAVVCLLITYSQHNAPPSEELPRKILVLPEMPEVAQPPLLPGQQRNISVRVRNTSKDTIEIREILFSCPYASLASEQGSKIPRLIRSKEDINIQVTVISPGAGINGNFSLRMDVRGGPDNIVLGSGLAIIECAGHMNAEPALLTFGLLKRFLGKRTERVLLWHPKFGQEPRIQKIATADPALTVIVSKYHKQESDRVYFAELTIALDTTIASSRIKEEVVVHSDVGNLQIPIFGFVEE